jgi:hypothetical protein
VRPALEFESLIETMFTLAAEGKTNRKGFPNPLRLAVIARSHFDTVRLPFPPVAAGGARETGSTLGQLCGLLDAASRACGRRVPRAGAGLPDIRGRRCGGVTRG